MAALTQSCEIIFIVFKTFFFEDRFKMNQEVKELEGAAGTQICKYHQVNSCPFGITCKFPHSLDGVPGKHFFFYSNWIFFFVV